MVDRGSVGDVLSSESRQAAATLHKTNSSLSASKRSTQIAASLLRIAATAAP